MTRRFSVQFISLGMLLGLLILFEYGKAFNFYFVGDDFSHIGFVIREGFQILWKPANYFHYYPLGLFINSLPACFGVLDPQWFVTMSFLFYWGCSLLVMKIYHDIAGSLTGGFLAALIFATAVPNAQVIYWKTGTQTIAMTFFSLLSLVFFMRHLKSGSKAAFAGSFVSFAASMSCIEQGIVTFGILALYDMIFFSIPGFLESDAERRQVVLRFLRRHIILIMIPIILTSLKLALGVQLSPFPLGSRQWGMLPLVTVDIIARLLDLNSVLYSGGNPTLAVSLAVVLSALFLSGYIFMRARGTGLFFLLASLGPILAISIGAGGPNPRYFCLPLAFYACFVSLFMSQVAQAAWWVLRASFTRIRRVSDFLTRESIRVQAIFSVALCLAIAWSGLRTNIIHRDYWETASTIQRNIVQTVEHLFLFGVIGTAKGQNLYLLNIPEHMVSQDHSIFYVASNSLMPDLRYRLGESADRIELIATGRRFEMSVGKERVVYRALGWKDQLSGRDVEKLIADGHIVMQFSPLEKTLVPLGGGNRKDSASTGHFFRR